MLIGAQELARRGYSLYRANFREFLKYGLVQYAPGFAAGIIMNMLQVTLAFFSTKFSFILYFIVAFLLQITALIVSYWIYGAFNRVIAARYFSQTPNSFNSEMQATKTMLWPAIISGVLFGLAMFFGTLLFMIPAIIFGVWFNFYAQAAFIDGKKGKQALTESRKLVEGNWWGILGRLLFIILSAGAIAVLIFAIPLFFSYFISNAWIMRALLWVLSVVLIFLYTVISIPYIMTCHTVLYLELKKNIPEAKLSA